MAKLTVICYRETAHHNSIPVRDDIIGKVSIDALSQVSDRVQLPEGTRYVKLVTDHTNTVYFKFGDELVVSDNGNDELNAGLGEKIMDRGTDGDNRYIAAIID
ncbi:MAG: hypothetical protein ACRBCK_10045 [Alphaproteobacteria bacterium]